MPELAEVLAGYRGRGYVVAPAGFGKTHLIAQAVALGNSRQLVLTHTYAGVNALRSKMRELGVRDTAFHVDTIASWALRLCLAYPASAHWTIDRPSGDQWTELYRACASLLDSAFIRRILQASYGGVYIDEYQDCSVAQHELVLRLARDLVCRILGDPLQGIFDFNDEPIDWERDVSASCACLGELDIPHRWERAGAAAIGAWLRMVRDRLERGQSIDLRHGLAGGVVFKQVGGDAGRLLLAQQNACRYFQCDRKHTVIAIHKGSQEYKARCHSLSKNLAGRFSSIEEIEGKALFSFVDRIQRAGNNTKRLKHLLTIAAQCMTAVNAGLPQATARGEYAEIRGNTRNPHIARSANAYLADPNSSTMAGVLVAVRDTAGVEVVRADLFNRLLGVLRKHMLHPNLTLIEAAEEYHSQFRHKGRPLGRRRLIGTTLLVKGLEFDHAIVLDAASLSRKELYVALTRGARSLTIISTEPVLSPTV